MLGVGGRGAPELGPYPTRNEVFNGLPHYNSTLAKDLFFSLFICVLHTGVCARAHGLGMRVPMWGLEDNLQGGSLHTVGAMNQAPLLPHLASSLTKDVKCLPYCS